MTETYELPQGKITISFSNNNLSIGLLELNSDQKLDRHNRPIDEELVQILGTSMIRFDNEDIILKEGEKTTIPAEKFHIHLNPTDNKSITLWKFKGNIVDIIENIKKNNKRIL